MGEDLRLRIERDPHADAVVAERNAGFSQADPLVRPVVSRGPFAYETVNVEQQQRDPRPCSAGRPVIRSAKQCPEIGWGDWRVVPTGSRNVLALAYPWRGNTIVCVHNLVRQGTGGEAAASAAARSTNLIDVGETPRDARECPPSSARAVRATAGSDTATSTRALAQRTVERR